MEYQEYLTIELKENHSQTLTDDTDSFGDYQTIIKPITLYDGDSLQLKSCFIDSVSVNSGKIKITEKEQNVSMNFIHYINDTISDDKEFNDNNSIISPHPNGQEYILCDNQKDNHAGMKLCNSIEIKGGSTSGWGDTTLGYNYYDHDNNKQTYYLNVPKLSKHDNTYKVDTTTPSAGLPFIFRSSNGVKATDDGDNRREHDIFPENEDTIESTGYTEGETRIPHIFTHTFTIPLGDYEPDELARVITDNCSFLTKTGELGTFPMDSPFLTSNQQFNSLHPQTDNKVYYHGKGTGKVFSINNSVDIDYYRYTNNDYLSGSSQIGLQFDDSLNKFKFTIINNPLYKLVNGQPQVSTESIQRGDGVYFVGNSSSGIAFTSLLPTSLWFDKLGLNRNICNHPNVISFDFGSGAILIPQMNLDQKINITGSYVGLDSAINKAGMSSDSNSYKKTAPLSALTSTSLTQNNIFGEDSIKNMVIDEGYFMIEVDFGGKGNELLGGEDTYYNRVSSIISRFYSTDSFTSAYNEGSIPYTHRGIQPLTISTFRTRILNSEGQLSQNIGNRNSVFIEIIRNQNPKMIKPQDI
jgi:hypothetical protein